MLYGDMGIDGKESGEDPPELDPKARSSTPTCVKAIGWHKGIISGHFFAAMMPAIRDVPRTSPFFKLFERINWRGVGLVKYTVPTAMAVRVVCCLFETLTMCAEPEAVRWGRCG